MLCWPLALHQTAKGREVKKSLSCSRLEEAEKEGESKMALMRIAKVEKQVETKILFTNPSARAGYDTRSIFKQSLTGFNSEFSFSETSCLTKAEEPSLPYYLPIAGGR